MTWLLSILALWRDLLTTNTSAAAAEDRNRVAQWAADDDAGLYGEGS